MKADPDALELRPSSLFVDQNKIKEMGGKQKQNLRNLSCFIGIFEDSPLRRVQKKYSEILVKSQLEIQALNTAQPQAE